MIRPSELYSPAYIETQRQLHAAPKGYGGKGAKWADGVLSVAEHFGATSILDYGSGEGTLATNIRSRFSNVYRVDEYDPAIPGKDRLPVFADLVVSTDVIEHVEHDCLDHVLAHIRMLARKVVFLVIATRPSNKVLSDGRNAHLTVESADWWESRVLSAGFRMADMSTPKSPLDKPSREWVAVLLP